MKDILIEYITIHTQTCKVIKLNPKDFFDESESNEFSVSESVAKHFLDPRNYINEKHSEILFLSVYIEDDYSNKLENKYTYWNNGLSQIYETCEYKLGVLSYKTTICSINTDINGTRNLVLRYEELNGKIVPITHLIEDCNINENDAKISSFDLTVFDKFR